LLTLMLLGVLCVLCVPPGQADNPTPSTAGLDDDSVIDRMTAELTAATQGMTPGFKLTPVQFEKVRTQCEAVCIFWGQLLSPPYQGQHIWG
jgi:uncharacterized protein CbrC (UPF0167 family)